MTGYRRADGKQAQKAGAGHSQPRILKSAAYFWGEGDGALCSISILSLSQQQQAA